MIIDIQKLTFECKTHILHLFGKDFQKNINIWLVKKGKALHILVSVSVLGNKPVGSMAGTALFSLAFFDYVCIQ